MQCSVCLEREKERLMTEALRITSVHAERPFILVGYRLISHMQLLLQTCTSLSRSKWVVLNCQLCLRDTFGSCKKGCLHL